MNADGRSAVKGAGFGSLALQLSARDQL